MKFDTQVFAVTGILSRIEGYSMKVLGRGPTLRIPHVSKPENTDPFSYSFEYTCMLLNFFCQFF